MQQSEVLSIVSRRCGIILETSDEFIIPDAVEEGATEEQAQKAFTYVLSTINQIGAKRAKKRRDH